MIHIYSARERITKSPPALQHEQEELLTSEGLCTQLEALVSYENNILTNAPTFVVTHL